MLLKNMAVYLLYTELMETKWQPPPTETWSSLHVTPSRLHTRGRHRRSLYPSVYEVAKSTVS